MLKASIGLAVLVSAFVAAPAYAAPIVLVAGPGGTLSGAFSATIVPAGPFTQTFTFTLPVAGVTSAAAISIAVNNITAIDFTAATLNGFTLTLSPLAGGEIAIIESLATLPGLQTLIINGNSGGDASFGGSVSFAPAAVPEPASWALMIAGFGMVGAMIRRRARTAAGVRVTFA